MKKLIVLLFLSVAFTLGHAQKFELPEDYRFEKADDYAAYEADVLSCIKWLMEAPMDEEPEKRADANGFLINWLTGVPYLTVELRSEMIPFTQKSPQLLVIFLAGWTEEALTGRKFDDMFAGNLAGIEAVIAYYSKNRKHLARDKSIERFARLQRKGKLEDFVAGVLRP